MLGTGRAAEPAVTFEELIEEHPDESAQSLRACGQASVGNECREAISEAEACLFEAFDNCEPAELRLDVAGTDAGFVRAVFVDVASDGTCRITQFTDNSADPFKGDYGDFVEADCASVVAQEFEPSTGACASVTAAECTTREDWYE